MTEARAGLGMIALVAVMGVALSGCIPIVPSRPFNDGYIAASAGGYNLRSICHETIFTQVEVLDASSPTTSAGSGVVWSAKSGQTKDVRLFEANAGFKVHSSGPPPENMIVRYSIEGLLDGAIKVRAGALRSGEVAWQGGISPLSELIADPTEFGC